MLLVISPAKTLDFETEAPIQSSSHPEFLEDSSYLVSKLKKFSSKKLQKLFSVNPDIAGLNVQRFNEWHTPFHAGNSKQAMYAFTGEVYRGLKPELFGEPDLEYAQTHLRILSGLYGILKPLDLIQAYRLEMGTSWAVTATKRNLYSYWSDRLRKNLEADADDDVLINLASIEYFKALQPSKLKLKVYNIHFRDLKNGEYKSLMTYAKRARGKMARYIIRHHLTEVDQLKWFDLWGYVYNAKLSTTYDLVFTRDQIPTE
jgi:uncharacterized protein